jgi:hypothetical protein
VSAFSISPLADGSPKRSRRLYRLAVAASIAAALVCGWIVHQASYTDFWFMPGPLGHVRIRTADLPRSLRLSISDSGPQRLSVSDFQRFGARPYLTRVIGLRTPEEQEWGRHNRLTDGIPFSHHLAAVFPRDLYKTHPEYFPLIAGKRLDPPSGPVFWQPDLGREDVAQHAAEEAKRYFDTHPTAESFSLGVNDGLNFGESPEVLALLRDHFRSRAVERSNRLAESDFPFDRPSVQAPLRSTVAQSFRPSDQPSSRSTATPLDRSTVRPSAAWPRYFRGRPDFSPLVFTFMNRAATDLARSHPAKYLGCLAYYWCENAPPFRVDPHVIPFLTADRSQSYDPAFVREEYDLQIRWAEALRAGNADKLTAEKADIERTSSGSTVNQSNRRTVSDPPVDRSTDQPQPSAFSASASQPRTASAATTPPPNEAPSDFQHSTFNFQPVEAAPRPPPRLGLYDYLDGFGFLVPRVAVHAFAEHIRHARHVGFTDYYGESSRNWGLDGPMPWVIAQLLQRPDANVDELIDVYYRAYFQSAAPPMRRFFARCEEQWMRQSGHSYWLKHYRNSSQATLFPSAVCAELRQLLDDAATVADTPDVRQRVAFVSDAFEITECFVALCEARDDLTTRVLRHELSGADGVRRLAEYQEKRRDFIRTAHAITERDPLAFYPVSYTDWLRDDPTFAAREMLAGNGRAEDPSFAARSELSRTVEQKDGGSEAENARTQETQNLAGSSTNPSKVQALRATDARLNGRELLSNGAFTGPLLPGRTITGLRYELDLPAPWHSRIEPTQFGNADLVSEPVEPPPSRSTVLPIHRSSVLPINRPSDQPPPRSTDLPFDRSSDRPIDRSPVPPTTRVLRLAGQENARVFNWVPAVPGQTYAVSAAVRANVSPSGIVELVLAWLDANQHHLGNSTAIRLPDGRWPDWVQLTQGAQAPAGAAWVGIQIVVEHQAPDEWGEFKELSLKQMTAETLKN